MELPELSQKHFFDTQVSRWRYLHKSTQIKNEIEIVLQLQFFKQKKNRISQKILS